MEPTAITGPRSIVSGPDPDGPGLNSTQFGDDIQHLVALPPETASSFTALLELPANRAVELLHSPCPTLMAPPVKENPPQRRLSSNDLTFPADGRLIERAARFSSFAGESLRNAANGSPETSSAPSNSGANSDKTVKIEPAETGTFPIPSPPMVSDPMVENGATRNQKPEKRKEVEKKAKGSSKKSKTAANGSPEDAEKLPYVHVRARRGQATDSHSLAERARREKINARMKLLQELVPGCNKISGTASVLDEIINHVQSLQQQVEFLSMRLAAVNPKIDFNLDNILAADGGSPLDCNIPNMGMPLAWPEVQVNGNRQQYQQQWHFESRNQPIWGSEDCYNFIIPENSLLSYDSSANSASLHSNQLRMEL